MRHGRAEGTWDTHADPGLSAEGIDDAYAAARALDAVAPLPLVTSPMRRAVETAELLGLRWGTTPVISEAVSEVPTPPAEADRRGDWLSEAMKLRWRQLPDELQGWRRSAIDYVSGLTTDTVVVTHLVLINALLGAADRDDRVITCSPGNGSVAVIDAGADGLHLVRKPDVTPFR